MARHLYFTATETPCVGICSTIYGDQVCRGCFRHYQDVIDWNTYPEAQKQKILANLNKEITAIMAPKISVIDEALLKQKCAQFHIKIRPTWHPLTWAHALLREGVDRIQDLTKYGLALNPAYADIRLVSLIEMLDDEIYDVSHRAL